MAEYKNDILKKQAALDLDKRPIHTPYVTTFNKVKTKDGFKISSVQLKRYYSVIDAEIYFMNNFVEDVSDINWVVSQNVMPLFGYNSYIYDEVARGSRLIQGTFNINFTSPNYLFDLLKTLDESNITDLKSYSQPISKDSIKSGNVQGKINTALEGVRETNDHGPIWDRTFDIDIILGEKTGNGDPVHVILEGVAIQSCATVLSAYCAGTPPAIQEQYQFIARDITTIG